LVRHHQDGLPRAESRDRPSDSRRDTDGYGDESANKANDPDEIHDGRHASQLPTTQFLLTTIGNLRSQHDVASLRGELALANSKLSVLKTPDAATRRRLHAAVDQAGGEDGANKRPRIEDAPAAAPAAQGDIPPRQLAPDPQQAPAWAPLPAAAPPPRELVYGTEARRTAEGNSNMDMFISLVLQDLYRRRLLKAPLWTDIDPPRHDYKERSLLKNTLELVKSVNTVEKREAFTADGMSAVDLEKFGKSVEKRCMSQILLYEGGSREVEAQTGTTKRQLI
jgi:hypothetical protein